MTETATGTRSGIDLFRERLKRAIDEADLQTLLAVLDVVEKEDDEEETPYVQIAASVRDIKAGRTASVEELLAALEGTDDGS